MLVDVKMTFYKWNNNHHHTYDETSEKYLRWDHENIDSNDDQQWI